MPSPTELGLALLRGCNYRVCRTEHWNAFAKVRHDLYGIADAVAVRSDVVGFLLVQFTSSTNHAARINKIFGIPETATILRGQSRIQIWSWGKRRRGTSLWYSRGEVLAFEIDLPEDDLTPVERGTLMRPKNWRL